MIFSGILMVSYITLAAVFMAVGAPSATANFFTTLANIWLAVFVIVGELRK